jgi:alpha-tubulin suppressor-like RCC1 family protein
VGLLAVAAGICDGQTQPNAGNNSIVPVTPPPSTGQWGKVPGPSPNHPDFGASQVEPPTHIVNVESIPNGSSLVTVGVFVPPPTVKAARVIAIAAGGCGGKQSFSLFLLNDGSLWGTGNNASGQLGDGTKESKTTPGPFLASGVIAIAAGGGPADGHSLFLTQDGSLWTVGSNSMGQLGDGKTEDRSVPQTVVNGEVIAIAAGGAHSLFLKRGGSLWVMGSNSMGQLGDGTGKNRF